MPWIAGARTREPGSCPVPRGRHGGEAGAGGGSPSSDSIGGPGAPMHKREPRCLRRPRRRSMLETVAEAVAAPAAGRMYVGLDVGAQTLVAVVLAPDGVPGAARAVANAPAGWEALRAHLAALGA